MYLPHKETLERFFRKLSVPICKHLGQFLYVVQVMYVFTTQLETGTCVLLQQYYLFNDIFFYGLLT